MDMLFQRRCLPTLPEKLFFVVSNIPLPPPIVLGVEIGPNSEGSVAININNPQTLLIRH